MNVPDRKKYVSSIIRCVANDSLHWASFMKRCHHNGYQINEHIVKSHFASCHDTAVDAVIKLIDALTDDEIKALKEVASTYWSYVAVGFDLESEAVYLYAHKYTEEIHKKS